MKKYLVITIDVEPDCTPTWQYSNPIAFEGVTTGIRSILQPLFNKYDIKPTYLINNVVLEDEGSVNTFINLEGNFELGTHLHPEFIEPAKAFHDYAGKKGQANCCFYPASIETEKIRNITRLFVEKFGYAPLSFRAGRFSAGDNTITALQELGYKVDTSVTPNVRWDDKTREHAVDFRSMPLMPYRIKHSIRQPDTTGTLLEVPVTIVRRKLSPVGYLRHIKTNKRLPYKGSSAVWFRPSFASISDYQYVFRTVAFEQQEGPVMVYNMMFHNVEVMPGLSPYTKTPEDCTRYLQSMEWVFQYAKENNIKSVTLSSLYDVFIQK